MSADPSRVLLIESCGADASELFSVGRRQIVVGFGSHLLLIESRDADASELFSVGHIGHGHVVKDGVGQLHPWCSFVKG